MTGPTRAHLAWPFFSDAERDFAGTLDGAISEGLLAGIDHHDADGSCIAIARRLGEAGLLAASVAKPGVGVAALASRRICLARETLAWHDGLADFAFAMQGLGSAAIAMAGDPAVQRAVLPKIASGEWLAAFALSEHNAGSDPGAMTCAARKDGDDYVLDGEKTWISNGGIAGVYTVFARTGERPGTRGISAFCVLADDPGFSISDRIATMAPHPLASLRFEACRIPAGRLLGEQGQGFKIAMRTLDIFRASVAAAALGFARRAFDETLLHVKSRAMFGATLADLQLTQAAIGDMSAAIDASALLTYRAAWARDVEQRPITREAAMAKMMATENAQAVIDRAVQLFGGRGVKSGEIAERLYREIRALRIYEGATDVQKLIIAREHLKG